MTREFAFDPTQLLTNRLEDVREIRNGRRRRAHGERIAWGFTGNKTFEDQNIGVVAVSTRSKTTSRSSTLPSLRPLRCGQRRDERHRVGCDRGQQRVRRDAPRRSHHLDRLGDPGGFIALAAIGNGREVQRVRFRRAGDRSGRTRRLHAVPSLWETSRCPTAKCRNRGRAPVSASARVPLKQ